MLAPPRKAININELKSSKGTHSAKSFLISNHNQQQAQKRIVLKKYIQIKPKPTLSDEDILNKLVNIQKKIQKLDQLQLRNTQNCIKSNAYSSP